MNVEVKNHRLWVDGKPVDFVKSPNQGSTIVPEILVLHYTGSNSMAGAISWMKSTQSGVSAHLVIGQDGKVVQMVDFNKKAWHAGKSIYGGRSSVNDFSIGIELVDTGDGYADAQIAVLKEVCRALFAAYDLSDAVGHEDVAPGRKFDPGRYFPWDKIFTETDEEAEE